MIPSKQSQEIRPKRFLATPGGEVADLLAYWRYDNYRRDLEAGAGFHFNSKQFRLHAAINSGERLWLFTRVTMGTQSQYRILARLNVNLKTINAPSYRYGAYRVWGDLSSSRYLKVSPDPREDAYELLRILPMDGPGLSAKNRVTLAQPCQTIRTLRPKASLLLESFIDTLEEEPRARTVPNEEDLEKAIYAPEPTQLDLMLKDADIPYPTARKNELRESRERNRSLSPS